MVVNISEIAAIVISSTIIGVGSLLFLAFKKYIRKATQQRVLHSIKQDAMIYGLFNVNHGFKDDFVPKYQEKYQELMKEYDFTNN